MNISYDNLKNYVNYYNQQVKNPSSDLIKSIQEELSDIDFIANLLILSFVLDATEHISHSKLTNVFNTFVSFFMFFSLEFFNSFILNI